MHAGRVMSFRENMVGTVPLIGHRSVLLWACATLFVAPRTQAQAASAALASRADLTAAATRAEAAAGSGDAARRAQSAMVAASIRRRLNEGDLQVGDRVVVAVTSKEVRTDTVVVRSGRVLELPEMVVVPVGGLLRSELHDRIEAEVLKYVKAQ